MYLHAITKGSSVLDDRIEDEAGWRQSRSDLLLAVLALMYLLGYNQSIYYWVVELLSPTRCNYRDRERHWLPAIALSPPPFIPSTPLEDRSSRNRRDFYNSQILIPIFLSGMFLSMPSAGHNPNLTKSDQTFRCLVGLTSPRRGSGEQETTKQWMNLIFLSQKNCWEIKERPTSVWRWEDIQNCWGLMRGAISFPSPLESIMRWDGRSHLSFLPICKYVSISLFTLAW